RTTSAANLTEGFALVTFVRMCTPIGVPFVANLVTQKFHVFQATAEQKDRFTHRGKGKGKNKQ
ncbi:MAG: hypothetical protein ACKPKO_22480, partial [Candidatus Fonsibacter sp.]